ncbi:hypothetical protein CLAFUW4_09295 [Fulvia fulva]|uniref:Nuclear segregation protein n=1 Tax=Passalora fulva TaxID=5499 RepID=A0A9Q8PFF4_PASFU|nr:uncharacterized protein CLAFUR5_09396 [Fulvia fulva]KAK4613837.1 hypothetical protein CLAFUR4_09301 [Fulvia fulva]UJO21440.1 hypothetical protein CLAFUR5_09396 [Fulvia fulva]WPV20300.1 hypothetical protein CLAFUW4_09295 [Fulvia fulva]WPV35360.1 hypothetical protein CLAFUW7_09296 [Fulvia fulva]
MAEVAETKAAPPAKPERPDEDTYKKNLAAAEKELKAAEERMKQIKAKIGNAQPQNKDSPVAKRQQELKTELNGIRDQQKNSKSGRGQVMDKIKKLDEQLKTRIAESKAQRSKVQYKSADDVEAEIKKLQAQVDSGKLKIVDEKKALNDISQLNRLKKSFANFDDAQKGIDATKAEIAELKKSMDDPASKALSERYSQIQAELDSIRAEQDDAFKNLNALRDERTKVHEDQQKKYAAVKEIKDAYYQQRRAAVDYEREARRIREEKRKAENDAYHRGRRQEAAKSKLEEASAPAFQDEIRITQSLIARLDPSSVTKQEASGPGKFAATDFRTVDSSGIKGTALKSKKDDDDDAYFIGGGGKKKKGGRGAKATGAASPTPEASSKFNLDLGTIEALARINVDPPMSQADVPAVVEKLKGKLETWKKDQDKQTKENIAKAQAEIERLEKEAAEADAGGRTNGTGAAAKSEKPVNGEAPVEDATQQLGAASLEEKTIETTA